MKFCDRSGAEDQSECLGLRYNREAYNIIYILYNVRTCMHTYIHTYMNNHILSLWHVNRYVILYEFPGPVLLQ